MLNVKLRSFVTNCPYPFNNKEKTRSVFANDKFVKLMQDVTRQRKIFEK